MTSGNLIQVNFNSHTSETKVVREKKKMESGATSDFSESKEAEEDDSMLIRER